MLHCSVNKTLPGPALESSRKQWPYQFCGVCVVDFDVHRARQAGVFVPPLVVEQVRLTCRANDCLNTHITVAVCPLICLCRPGRCLHVNLCVKMCEQGLKCNAGSVHFTVSLLCFYTWSCAVCVDSKSLVKRTVCVCAVTAVVHHSPAHRLLSRLPCWCISSSVCTRCSDQQIACNHTLPQQISVCLPPAG